jgi:hypothetical protein
MIVEIRTYKATRGDRAELLELIRTKLFDELKRIGAKCAGPWVSPDDEQTFVWLRGFPDQEARQTMSNRFYGGAFWEEDMAPRIMPKLEKHDVVAIEMDEHAVKWA